MDKHILKSTIGIMLLGIVSKSIGFIKQLVIAYYYGANSSTDSFFLASGFVGNISYLMCSTLSITMLTMYITEKKKNDIWAVNRFVSSVTGIFISFALVIIFLLSVFADPIMRIFAPTYSLAEIQNSVVFFRMLLVLIILQVMIAIDGTVLNAEKNFLPNQFNRVILSVTMIACVALLQKKLDIYALIIGEILAYFIQMVYFKISTRKYYTLTKFHLHEQKSTFKLIKLIIPLLFSYGAIAINQIVDKIVTTSLGEGVLSSLSYGQIIFDAINVIFISSLVTVFYTYFSEVVESGYNKASMMLSESVTMVIIILIPVTFWTVCLSAEITTVVYGHGKFDQDAIHYTSLVQIGYCIGLCAVGIRELLVRAHYAFLDTKKPTYISVISIGVNIVGSITLSRYIGILGVTLASSISVFISVILLSFTLKKHEIEIKKIYNAKELIKIGISAGISIFVILSLKSIIDSLVLRLAVLVSASAVTYIGILYMLKIKEIFMLIDTIKRISKKKNSVKK